VRFFEKNAGISSAYGLTDETCKAMADWIEKNPPPTAEQLPESEFNLIKKRFVRI
jgi:hypothetical protein